MAGDVGIESAVRGRSRGCRRRYRRPRLDYLHQWGEEDAAEVPIHFDLHGELRNDGGELDSVAAMEVLGRGERTRRGSSKWGKGVRSRRMASLTTGGPRRRASTGGHGGKGGMGARHGASAGRPLWRRRHFPENPLATFSLIAKWSSSRL